MSPLVFEDYGQMSDYIRAHGPLPTDKEIRVGNRVILPGPTTRENGDTWTTISCPSLSRAVYHNRDGDPIGL